VDLIEKLCADRRKMGRTLLCLVSLGVCETASVTFDQFAGRVDSNLSAFRGRGIDSLYFPMNSIYLLLSENRVVPAYIIDYEALA
jgi:hypothetical protein